jgi:N-hydroxyarylamine O-acetyltransferase
LLAVPFENLDIHLGRPILLDQTALYDKIVTRRRGGFCYELNGLFAALLSALGFRVKLLSAGVAREEGGFGPEFDHLALLVELEESWLADVGFGDGFRRPLRLDSPSSQPDFGSVYEIAADGDCRVLLRDGKPQYRLTLAAHSLDEFAGMCRYHQTSPASSFTRRRLCTVATPEGRTTLTGMRLIETSAAGRMERTLAGEDEFRALLASCFNVVL